MPVWINWIDEPSPVAVTIISIALMLASEKKAETIQHKVINYGSTER